MNDPIDIVVTWVDQNDPVWQEEYLKYKNLELEAGAQKLTNEQAFNPARYRDWGTFRFWFRAVEKNCPWIHKVFLVVANERQIPSWLKKDHPKLRIVYHNEYIPADLLPTFNIMPIEMFYYRIPDLSNNFITSNDDFFFLNPCDESMFFINNKCVQRLTKRPYRIYGSADTWGKILNNNVRFLTTHLGNVPTFKYSHLFEPRQKDFEKKIMTLYYDEIYNSFTKSRFRHPDNYLSWLFIDYMKAEGPHVEGDSYQKSRPISLTSKTDFDSCKDLQMVCFNDTERTDDFENTKIKLQKFLLDKFPRKSSFELNELNSLEIEDAYKVYYNKTINDRKIEDETSLDGWLKTWGK